MPAFNAGSVVEPLDYAFDSCTGDHEGPCWKGTGKTPRPAKCTVFVPGCHGAVQEPTDRQVADYLAGMQALVRKYEDQLPGELITGTADAAALTTAVKDLDAEVIVNFHADLAGLVAQLCSGEPSRDDLITLPLRIRGFFYNWVTQEVMSPEAAPGGGSTQARKPQLRAAG